MKFLENFVVLLSFGVLITLSKDYGADAKEYVDADCLVTIDNGQIQGHVENNYCSFKRIPYAEPPIGQNRFEPPQPFTNNWNGILNATEYSEVCLQWNQFLQPNGDYLIGNEDCLYVNVFTRALNKSAKLPVFVNIHGGAFMYGSGDYFGPKYLLQHKNVVFVSLNYRLGPLGFLSTEDNVVPGNMGMKDQTMALHWIQQNIENFGGDPKNVIIGGLSAGGASVHMHYLSKKSSGLFRKGIAHSGCALNAWVLVEKSLERTKTVSESVGCGTGPTNEMINCMKSKSAMDIVRSSQKLQPWRYNPFSPFGIVVEKNSENAFLTDAPIKLLRTGEFTKAPIIFIIAQKEGLYPVADFYDENILHELDENWNSYAPHILHYNDVIPSESLAHYSESIRRHYFGNEKFSHENFEKLVNMASDRLFKYDIEIAARLQADTSSENVYFCNYAYANGTRSISNFLAKNFDVAFGAGHGDDHLIFLDNAMHTQLSTDELEMGKKFIEMYYSFALSDQTLQFGDVSIEPVLPHAENLKYLDIINLESVDMKSSKDLAQYSFWKNIPFDENLSPVV